MEIFKIVLVASQIMPSNSSSAMRLRGEIGGLGVVAGGAAPRVSNARGPRSSYEIQPVVFAARARTTVQKYAYKNTYKNTRILRL